MTISMQEERFHILEVGHIALHLPSKGHWSATAQRCRLHALCIYNAIHACLAVTCPYRRLLRPGGMVADWARCSARCAPRYGPFPIPAVAVVEDGRGWTEEGSGQGRRSLPLARMYSVLPTTCALARPGGTRQLGSSHDRSQPEAASATAAVAVWRGQSHARSDGA